MKYPDIKKGIRWCFIVGGFAVASWMGWCYWASTIPAVSEVSVSLALQPWWKLWKVALFLFLVTGMPIGILAAFRPDVRGHKKTDDHDA